MNCLYCGSPIPPNTASCPACGAKCEVQPASAVPAAATVPDSPVDLYIVGLLDQSKKVDAIKMISGITGWGLLEAKNAVEGNLTPIKFGIAVAEATALQSTLAAVGVSTTIQPANPALKSQNGTNGSIGKLHTAADSQKKSGCLIMFVPLAAAVIWFMI